MNSHPGWITFTNYYALRYPVKHKNTIPYQLLQKCNELHNEMENVSEPVYNQTIVALHESSKYTASHNP